jgi:transcriptional regulator with XRE-family HTH domain
MPKIVPFTLIRLRKAKRWSLEQLGGKARIDKQTIWRLENGEHTTVRETTVQKLARALGVEPAVLTGQTAVPETEDDDVWPSDHTKLKFRISTSAYNAICLVAERYNVKQQGIVELAPFLFCWAAEASLRQRRGRLDQARRACENALNVEREMQHLRAHDFSFSEEKFAAESKSIDSQDLFGTSLEEGGFGPDNTSTDNPFALFLSNLAEEIGGGATFDEYDFCSWPFYRVCEEEAAELAGHDAEVAEYILDGHVALHEMPKGIRGVQEERQWVRTKFEEFRNGLLRSFEQQGKADKASS